MEGSAAARLTPREGRRFGLTLAAAFAGLAALLWWRGEPGVAGLLAPLAAALALAGLVVPGRLGPVHRAWMGMARALSKVTTPIFMSVVYFAVITPTGILRRTIGGNPLRRAGVGGSCWVPRTDSPHGDLERQF
ncbi:MAG: hypothetical protein ACE5JR_07360 [Gemmatimonadota bacterium]